MAGDGILEVGGLAPVVALSAERLAVWMASDLSKFDPLIIQIDGLRIGNDQVLGLRSARERRQTSARLTFRGHA